MISAVEHFSYCPRQCGLIHVEAVFDENIFTLKGRMAHDRTHDEEQTAWEGGVRIERGLPLPTLLVDRRLRAGDRNSRGGANGGGSVESPGGGIGSGAAMTRELLNTLYVMTPGAYVRLDHETLRVDADGQTLARVPIQHLGALVLFARVGISGEALRRCAQEGRAVTLLDSLGRFGRRRSSRFERDRGVLRATGRTRYCLSSTRC